MQPGSYLKYILIVTGTVYFSTNTMENENFTLRDYIKHYKDSISEIHILNSQNTPDIINIARNTMNPALKNCQTEQDVYHYMEQNYIDARANLITFLKTKRFTYDQTHFTDEIIEKLEHFFNNDGSNTLTPYPPQEIDNQTILWNEYKWKNTKLIPQENLGIVNACTHFLGIDKSCFITVQTPKISNAIMAVRCDQVTTGKGFILGLSEDSVNTLSSNPLLLIHILLHEFTHLKKGDGVIQKAIMGGLSYSIDPTTKTMRHSRCFTLPTEIKTYIDNLELRADIESIIKPGNNRMFTLDEKKIIYQIAIETQASSYGQINKLFYYKLLRLQTLIRLYDIINTQEHYTLFGYKVSAYC
jgi:hypothetical protein